MNDQPSRIVRKVGHDGGQVSTLKALNTLAPPLLCALTALWAGDSRLEQGQTHNQEEHSPRHFELDNHPSLKKTCTMLSFDLHILSCDENKKQNKNIYNFNTEKPKIVLFTLHS